jgi:glycosyltransferase involved in cell wall biosynthesis
MPAPTISVVIPCYNVELYVRAALDSVLQQRPPLSEIIVIDDGSTDGTSAVLSDFCHLPRVTVRRTANAGLGPARNAGLEIARGDYVYFLDSDDLMAPTFSASVRAALCGGEDGTLPDLVCFSGANFLDDEYRPAADADQRVDFLRRKDALLRRTIRGRFVGAGAGALALHKARCFFPNAYLYLSRRSLWEQNTLRFKPILHEDVELILPLFAAARDVVVVEDVVYHRRIRLNSIMTSGLSTRSLEARGVILRSLLSYPTTDRVYRAMAPLVTQQLARACARYLSTADKLRVSPDWRLSLRAVARLRSATLFKRLARVWLNAAARRGPAAVQP